MKRESFGWFSIARLGLVQASLGAIVVIATSTMNRVMVVEVAMPALLPGALVGLHYMIQVLRPRLGFGSDVGGRRTPWIVGGMAMLGAGLVLAAIAIACMQVSRGGGVALAVVAFALIGIGVGAAGTSLLVLLAKRVEEKRRAAAATAVWLMMIVGFVVSTIVVGQLLDPYSPLKLLKISCGVALIALTITLLAVRGLEAPHGEAAIRAGAGSDATTTPQFREALAQVWQESQARRLTIFIFVSMLAYSGQELILEPFAGAVFGMTPGQSTQLSGLQHGGVLVGMILVNIACALLRGSWLASLRTWTILGCVASAAALLALTSAGSIGLAWPLKANVFLLGMANGAFAVSAIGTMMSLAGAGRQSREGVRMGLWGAAQAVAFGLGGFLGAAASDLARSIFAMPGLAYGIVFAAEGVLFLVASGLAMGLRDAPAPARASRRQPLLATALATAESAE